MSYDEPTELDYIEVSTDRQQSSLTLLFRDRGEGDYIHGGTKVSKSFSFSQGLQKSTKEQREELVESFRRFLVACGYPSDPTMEPGYKKDKE